MAVDAIRRLIEVDLLAAIELTRVLLPGMVERKRGAICFVTSIAGRTGSAGEAVYSATKAGLDAFAESLRAETAGSGVNISVVVPGVVDTGFFETRGSSLYAHAATTDTCRHGAPTPWSERWSATAPKSGRRGGYGSPRPCARWLPARSAGLRSASVVRLTRPDRLTQRNPMCVVALSCDCGERAAGR